MNATPFLLGAEPARIGPFRILGEEEDAAFALLDQLTTAQKELAVIHDKPPADFVTRTVPTVGAVEYPDHHGVGRRDAMITDEDRRALAYFRDHPRGIRIGDLSPTQRSLFDDLLATFVHRARPAWSGSRWTASPPPAGSRSCTSPGPAAPRSSGRTTSASRAALR